MEQIIKQMPEYKTIKECYGDRETERSVVPLINHIHEGLEILDIIGASKDAMRAFCLHPLIQEDNALNNMSSEDILFSFSPRVVMLAMEYRYRANAWLSDKVKKSGYRTIRNGVECDHISTIGTPRSGPLLEVKQMLIADKIQNYKDFKKHHQGVHERSEELAFYFHTWFEELRVDGEIYTDIVVRLENRTMTGNRKF